MATILFARDAESFRYEGHEGELYRVTTHRGLVVGTGEMNGYDDSDFYAIVWNAAKGEPERIEYATTRGWTYPNHAEVDATPAVAAAYGAWLKAREEESRARAVRAERLRPATGKRARVVRGRKLAKGTEGYIFYVGNSGYGMRVGLETPDGRVFTAMDNIEVLDLEAR